MQKKKPNKQEWKLAADAARNTDVNASSEDLKHTSGRVFVAVDSNMGAVVGTEERAIESISGPSVSKCARRYAGLLSVLLAF